MPIEELQVKVQLNEDAVNHLLERGAIFNDWLPATDYVRGNTVRTGTAGNTKAYLCLNDHTSGQTFAAGSDWLDLTATGGAVMADDNIPAWAAQTTYAIGDLVRTGTGSSSKAFMAVANHTSGAAFPDPFTAQWLDLSGGTIDLTALTTRVSSNETNIAANTAAIANKADTSAIPDVSGIATNATAISTLQSLVNTAPLWTDNTSYEVGDIRRVGTDKAYMCTADHSVGSGTSFADTNWVDLTNLFSNIPEWIASNDYNVGDLMRISTRPYFCKTAHTSGASSPTGTDLTDNWVDILDTTLDNRVTTLEGQVRNIPAWAATTVYAVGDTMRNAAATKAYLCKTAHTSGAAFPTGSDLTDNWTDLTAAGSGGGGEPNLMEMDITIAPQGVTTSVSGNLAAGMSFDQDLTIPSDTPGSGHFELTGTIFPPFSFFRSSGLTMASFINAANNAVIFSNSNASFTKVDSDTIRITNLSSGNLSWRITYVSSTVINLGRTSMIGFQVPETEENVYKIELLFGGFSYASFIESADSLRAIANDMKPQLQQNFTVGEQTSGIVQLVPTSTTLSTPVNTWMGSTLRLADDVRINDTASLLYEATWRDLPGDPLQMEAFSTGLDLSRWGQDSYSRTPGSTTLGTDFIGQINLSGAQAYFARLGTSRSLAIYLTAGTWRFSNLIQYRDQGSNIFSIAVDVDSNRNVTILVTVPHGSSMPDSPEIRVERLTV